MKNTKQEKPAKHLLGFNYTKKELNELNALMEQGNIIAHLQIIMHNQVKLNEKLNKLLKIRTNGNTK